MLTQNRVAQARTGQSNWTALPFGKHQGKSLPEVLFDDPDWFFWAIDRDFLYGRVRSEAEILFCRARNIKIPGNPKEGRVAEYQFDPFTREFSGLRIVPSSKSVGVSASNVYRRDRIDMSVPYKAGYYDKKGCRILVNACERYLFAADDFRPKRERYEEFFSNPDKFL